MRLGDTEMKQMIIYQPGIIVQILFRMVVVKLVGNIWYLII